ncbi:MAG: hypothetical protein SNJ78_03655 [Spirochaetales bacterium]
MNSFGWVLLNLLTLIGIFFFLKSKINRALQVENIVSKARKELEEILVELNHTTERNIALLEDKMLQVKETLAGVDKRLSVLHREMEKQVPPTYNSIVQQKASVRPQEIKRTLQEEVLDLYNKGISPTLIASHLGTTVGEVELIISLKDRKERETY